LLASSPVTWLVLYSAGVEVDHDRSQAVAGQADRVDRPDVRRSDHHLVAGDEPAGVGEQQPDVIVRAARQQHDRDQDRSERQCAGGAHPRGAVATGLVGV
jgi:hypothetical protein